MRRAWVIRGLLVLAGLLIAAPVLGYGILMAASTPSRACNDPATGPVQPGTSARIVASGGQERCYLLHIPPGYDPAAPAPLIISLHGFASSAEDQQYRSGWDKLADAEMFLVAYPHGSGAPLRWNTDSRTNLGDIDDVQFMRDLIDDVAGIAALDAGRVYITGFSNGAGMAEIVACEAADRIAALGLVSGYGPQPGGGCHPSRSVPVIGFFGLDDPLVASYEGGMQQASPFVGWLFDIRTDPIYFPSFDDWVAGWAARNECNPQADDIPATGDASGSRYTGCDGDAEVVIYLIEGGGHAWPGGPTYVGLGKVSADIDASATMWEFFQAHPLPDGDG